VVFSLRYELNSLIHKHQQKHFEKKTIVSAYPVSVSAVHGVALCDVQMDTTEDSGTLRYQKLHRQRKGLQLVSDKMEVNCQPTDKSISRDVSASYTRTDKNTTQYPYAGMVWTR
jgi:hypothetical protein